MKEKEKKTLDAVCKAQSGELYQQICTACNHSADAVLSRHLKAHNGHRRETSFHHSQHFESDQAPRKIINLMEYSIFVCRPGL